MRVAQQIVSTVSVELAGEKPSPQQAAFVWTVPTQEVLDLLDGYSVVPFIG
jgi:hypothetical protein